MEKTEIIKHPLSTEKSIRLMESENKLMFVVDRKSTKKEIKKPVSGHRVMMIIHSIWNDLSDILLWADGDEVPHGEA